MPLLQVRILNRVSELDVRQDGSLRNVPPVDVVTCLQDNKVVTDYLVSMINVAMDGRWCSAREEDSST